MFVFWKALTLNLWHNGLIMGLSTLAFWLCDWEFHVPFGLYHEKSVTFGFNSLQISCKLLLAIKSFMILLYWGLSILASHLSTHLGLDSNLLLLVNCLWNIVFSTQKWHWKSDLTLRGWLLLLYPYALIKIKITSLIFTTAVNQWPSLSARCIRTSPGKLWKQITPPDAEEPRLDRILSNHWFDQNHVSASEEWVSCKNKQFNFCPLKNRQQSFSFHQIF